MPATCLCGSDRSDTLQTGVRNNDPFTVHRCSDCGLTYLWPRPSPEELEQYYAGAYRAEYGMVSSAELERDSLRRLDLLQPLLAPHVRLLDVGSGSGAFLRAVAPHVREAAGVEPDEGGSLDEAGSDFDLVTAFHVLEHVHDPVRFLGELASKLASGGRIVLEVPNVDDALVAVYEIPAYRRFYFHKAHLWYFSPQTLAAACARAGFVAAVSQVQRYDLDNHLVWMQRGEPGGRCAYALLEPARDAYARALVTAGVADTLWAVAVPATRV